MNPSACVVFAINLYWLLILKRLSLNTDQSFDDKYFSFMSHVEYPEKYGFCAMLEKTEHRKN